MAPLHQAGKAADYSSCNSLCQERSRKVHNGRVVCLSVCVSCLLLVWWDQVVDKRRWPLPHLAAVCALKHRHNRRRAGHWLSEHGGPFTSGSAVCSGYWPRYFSYRVQCHVFLLSPSSCSSSFFISYPSLSSFLYPLPTLSFLSLTFSFVRFSHYPTFPPSSVPSPRLRIIINFLRVTSFSLLFSYPCLKNSLFRPRFRFKILYAFLVTPPSVNAPRYTTARYTVLFHYPSPPLTFSAEVTFCIVLVLFTN